MVGVRATLFADRSRLRSTSIAARSLFDRGRVEWREL
jgi:hypothetical protein